MIDQHPHPGSPEWWEERRIRNLLSDRGPEQPYALTPEDIAALSPGADDVGESFAWLIEAPGQNFLSAREFGHQTNFYWTTDTQRALRFWSKDQADRTMMAVRQLNPDLWAFARNLGDAWPREHKWLAAAPRPAGDERTGQDEADEAWLEECKVNWTRLEPENGKIYNARIDRLLARLKGGK